MHCSSLDVGPDLVGDAMVLATAEFLILSLTVALAVGPQAEAHHACIVLVEPVRTRSETFRFELVNRILVFLTSVQMRGVILGEVGEELRAV